MPISAVSLTYATVYKKGRLAVIATSETTASLIPICFIDKTDYFVVTLRNKVLMT